MSSLLKYFVTLCISSVLAGTTSINAAAPGFVEGHLKIISPREVELANGTPASITAESYAEYPLIILSRDEKKEIARVTARSEEHTSELQSQSNLVCRLLLEKK